jgi:hypothetical protein
MKTERAGQTSPAFLFPDPELAEGGGNPFAAKLVSLENVNLSLDLIRVYSRNSWLIVLRS